MILLLITFAAVVLTGAYLLVRGLRVRRRGDTPHCARCNYMLTGLVAREASAPGVPATPSPSPSPSEWPRCPECGATLEASNVVRGERYRRRSTALGGAVLLLVGLLPLGAFLAAQWRGIDWYQYRPAGWLIDDVEHRGTPRALTELERRQQAGSLGASHRDRLVELALAEQAKPTLGPLGPGLIDFAGTALNAGQMSDAQRERFFQQMVRMTLIARSPVEAGRRDAPYRLEYTSRGPSGGFGRGLSLRIVSEEAELGGHKHQMGGSGGLSGAGAGGATGGYVMAPTTPGRHTLTTRSRVQVFSGGGAFSGAGGGDPAATPLHERVVTLTTDVDVVADMADAITQNDDPSLAPTILACLQMQEFKHGPYGLSGQVQAVVAVPVDVAFDVILRVGDVEYKAGWVTFRAGAKGHAYHVQLQGDAQPATDVKRVDVILRSSPDAARRTVDMTSLWMGELVYPNVPVAPGAPAKL